jgi:hypothetical protein
MIFRWVTPSYSNIKQKIKTIRKTSGNNNWWWWKCRLICLQACLQGCIHSYMHAYFNACFYASMLSHLHAHTYIHAFWLTNIDRHKASMHACSLAFSFKLTGTYNLICLDALSCMLPLFILHAYKHWRGRFQAPSCMLTCFKASSCLLTSTSIMLLSTCTGVSARMQVSKRTMWEFDSAVSAARNEISPESQFNCGPFRFMWS